MRHGLKTVLGLGALALSSVCLAVDLRPSYSESSWLEIDPGRYAAFLHALPQKLADSDAVVVGTPVMAITDKGVIALFRISERLKGGPLVRATMAAYPDVPGCVLVAYQPAADDPRRKPRGETLLFMTRPQAAGKSLHLLGDTADQGMICARPDLLTTARSLLASGGYR